MRASRGLHLDYLSLAEYPSARWADVLGVATFNAPPPTACSDQVRNGSGNGCGELGLAAWPADIPIAQVSTPPLTAPHHVHEVWGCGEPAESGQRERLRFRRTGQMLFGCIAVSEGTAASGTSRAPSPLQQATVHAYREICAALDAENYPHLLRMWNYLPDINQRDAHGLERYRQFNSARQQALRACGRALSGNVPAASALGAAPDSPLVVYFLASRTAPTFVENPRQVSAYHYPRRYGAHSPVFSRAALWRQPGALTLFISGTSSIVGHRSLHVGDTAAQTRETLTNIGALLDEANRIAPGAHFALEELACKVYVRRPADLPVIEAELRATLGPNARIVYLQADICRQDLLVEIEATGMSPLAAHA